ncbi:MAG: diacylglycerol kinase [Sedimentisphaerales bacterium]
MSVKKQHFSEVKAIKLFGIKRLIPATQNSLKGIKAVWRNEEAFRSECILLALAIPIALWLGETLIQQILLIVSVLFVIVIELLNSAIETTINRIGLERNELSGMAKDIGSAAVLVSLIIMAIIWCTILFGIVFSQ